MPMHYDRDFLPPADLPRARLPLLQHLVETYASETSKTAAVWSELTDGQLEFRPHARSSSVRQILVHQLLSERRFFGEFLGAPEPAAVDVLPSPLIVASAIGRLCALAVPRLAFLAAQAEPWWLTRVVFFDVERERAWIVWSRLLHTAHHRTQLSVYLRLLDRPVPATYGPTADATWDGADPTTTADAASRR